MFYFGVLGTHNTPKCKHSNARIIATVTDKVLLDFVSGACVFFTDDVQYFVQLSIRTLLQGC